jgi:hypothetical protein
VVAENAKPGSQPAFRARAGDGATPVRAVLAPSPRPPHSPLGAPENPPSAREAAWQAATTVAAKASQMRERSMRNKRHPLLFT